MNTMLSTPCLQSVIKLSCTCDTHIAKMRE